MPAADSDLHSLVRVHNRGMNQTRSRIEIQQHSESSYAPRTQVNASRAGLTVAFAVDYSTAGERLTKKMAGIRYASIPLEGEPLEAARLLYRSLRVHDARSLNIAGNGIYTLASSWTQASVNQWVYDVLAIVHQHWPLESIRSGGQTGVDIAGLVAGYALGVERVTALLPHGYIQRGADGVDREHTAQEIRVQIEQGASELDTTRKTA